MEEFEETKYNVELANSKILTPPLQKKKKQSAINEKRNYGLPPHRQKSYNNNSDITPEIEGQEANLLQNNFLCRFTVFLETGV